MRQFRSLSMQKKCFFGIQLQLFLSEDEDRRMLSGRTQMEVFLRRGVVMVLMRRSFSEVLAVETSRLESRLGRFQY